MIGNGPDIPSYDKEREKEMRLGDEVQGWWDSLDDNYKYELLEPYYPDRIDLWSNESLLQMGLMLAWEDLSWDDQLEIFKEANGFGEGVVV